MLQKKVSYRFLNENQAIQNVSIETMLSSSEIKTAHFIIVFHMKLVILSLTKNIEISNSILFLLKVVSKFRLCLIWAL